MLQSAFLAYGKIKNREEYKIKKRGEETGGGVHVCRPIGEFRNAETWPSALLGVETFSYGPSTLFMLSSC